MFAERRRAWGDEGGEGGEECMSSSSAGWAVRADTKEPAPDVFSSGTDAEKTGLDGSTLGGGTDEPGLVVRTLGGDEKTVVWGGVRGALERGGEVRGLFPRAFAFRGGSQLTEGQSGRFLSRR